MKKTKKQISQTKINPFFYKLVIALTIYGCSFYYTYLLYYPEMLKTVTVFLLMGKSLWHAIKHVWTPIEDGKESLITFMIFCCLLIGKFDDAVISSFLFQIFQFYRKRKVAKPVSAFQVEISRGKSYTKKSVDKVSIGNILRLKSQEKLLVDGILKIPKAYFKKENGPRFAKRQGDLLLAGWICQTENVLLEVKKPYHDTNYYEKEKRLSRIKEETSSSEQGVRKRIELLQKIGNPLFVVLVFYFLFLKEDVDIWGIYLSIFLFTLINTIPLRLFYDRILQKGIDKLGKEDIILNKKEKFFLLPKVPNYIFEKTGTLTVGEFRITEVDSEQEEEIFYYLNYGEYFSHHPIANAVRTYHKIEVDAKKIKNYQEVASRGISCQVDGKQVLIGNSYYMKEQQVEIEKNFNVGTIIYVAVDQIAIGSIVISDGIKYSTKDAIAKLGKKKKRYLAILSSDNERIVNAIAKELEIPDHYSNLTEEEKKFWISHIRENHAGLFALVGSQDTKKELYDQVDLSIILASNAKQIKSRGDFYLLDNDLLKLIPAIEITSLYRKKLKYLEIGFWLIEIGLLILHILGYFPLFLLLLLRIVEIEYLEKRREKDERYRNS